MTGCCGRSTIRTARRDAARRYRAGNGADVLVINAMGRVFMPDLDSRSAAIDAELAACPLKQGADAIVIDFHAEATSEKQALAHFLDGRASAVVGTHTHTPTADERVLPGGTAFMSRRRHVRRLRSVLGMEPEEPLHRFLTKIPKNRFEPAGGAATLSGLAIEIDDATGLASRVAALRLGRDARARRAAFLAGRGADARRRHRPLLTARGALAH